MTFGHLATNFIRSLDFGGSMAIVVRKFNPQLMTKRQLWEIRRLSFGQRGMLAEYADPNSRWAVDELFSRTLYALVKDTKTNKIMGWGIYDTYINEMYVYVRRTERGNGYGKLLARKLLDLRNRNIKKLKYPNNKIRVYNTSGGRKLWGSFTKEVESMGNKKKSYKNVKFIRQFSFG